MGGRGTKVLRPLFTGCDALVCNFGKKNQPLYFQIEIRKIHACDVWKRAFVSAGTSPFLPRMGFVARWHFERTNSAFPHKSFARIKKMIGKQALASFCILSAFGTQGVSAFTPTPIAQNGNGNNMNVNVNVNVARRIAKNGLNTASRQNQHHKLSQRLMCGLVAAIDDIWNSKPVGFDSISLLNDHAKEINESLVKTSKILYHRGPDGMTCSSGSIGTEDSGSVARWAMGHTRLAIVDPNNRKADMPFQLDFEVDGKMKKIKLAANGEIYNHEQVYSDLVENDSWPHERISGSDCEVIAHHFAKHGGPATAAKLDGMFAFVVFEENVQDGTVNAFAARDPVGIKPLYFGRTLNADADKEDASGYVFASELKALVGHVVPESVTAIPAGHYWTPEEGLVCYYNPDWLRKVRSIAPLPYSHISFYLSIFLTLSYTTLHYRTTMRHGKSRATKLPTMKSARLSPRPPRSA